MFGYNLSLSKSVILFTELTESCVREWQSAICVRIRTGFEEGVDESVHEVNFSQHHRKGAQHRDGDCCERHVIALQQSG